MFDVINNAQQSRVDKLQLSALACLMLVGVAFIYSATGVSETGTGSLLSQFWFKQIVWYAVGAGIAAGLCVVDYRSLSRFSFIIYWLTILLLIARANGNPPRTAPLRYPRQPRTTRSA